MSVEVKLCGVLLVGIPATECITLCRQLSGVSGGSVIRNILAGGCFAVLGDKAYFVIVGCPLGVNRGVALDGLGKVKLCVVVLVGIPADECITLCRQLSGVSGGSVILDILAGGCLAVLGDKAYFVILGCPLGVNRGVARDGLGKVKLFGVGLVGIPAIECITIFRQLSGVGGGSVILNILAGGWVAVLGEKAYVVIVGCPLGSQRYIACGDSGKIKFFIAVVPACKGIVFFGRFRNKFCKFAVLIVVYELRNRGFAIVRVKGGFQLVADEGVIGKFIRSGNLIPLLFGTGIGYSHRARTAIKSIDSNESDRDRNADGFEISAMVKSIRLNRRNRIWNVNRGQLRAAEKKSL